MIAHLTPLTKVKKHFDKLDPKILAVLETVNLSEWFEVRSTDDHFYNLTRNIIYQQLAGKAASTIFGRFKDLVGDIKPENVATFEDQSFRDVGLSWAKAKYVKDLATKVISGEVKLGNIDTLDNENVSPLYPPPRKHFLIWRPGVAQRTSQAVWSYRSHFGRYQDHR
jgi:DNA-3-methyladenine glycosylase II